MVEYDFSEKSLGGTRGNTVTYAYGIDGLFLLLPQWCWLWCWVLGSGKGLFCTPQAYPQSVYIILALGIVDFINDISIVLWD